MDCEKHAGEQVLMICSTCAGDALCIKCAIHGNHKNHDVKDITKLGANLKTRLQNLVIKENVSDSELGQQLSHITKTLSKNQEISDDICALIDKRGEFLKLEIDKISRALKTKCRQYQKENEESCKNRQQNIQTCISNCTRALDSGNPAEQVKTLRRTQGFLKQPNMSFDENSISFNEGSMHDSELENIFGTVSMSNREDGNTSEVCVIANTTAEGAVASNEQSMSVMYEECSSDIYRKPRKSTILPTASCNSFQQSTIAGVSLICPHVKENNKCWVKCQQEREIKLVSEFGKTEMTVRFDMRIRGMDMTSDGTLYVASHQIKAVLKIFKDGSNLQKTKAFSTGNLMPYHICVDLDDNLLITLLDEDNFELKNKSRRILARFNGAGKMIAHVEHDDRGKRLFVVPDKVHVNRNNGDVIVINRVSRDSRHLVVLDSRLKLKFRHLSGGTILPKEIMYDQEQNETGVQKFVASDVCTDSYGNVLMAVPHRNCVYLLNSHFIYENTLAGSDDSPWSLASQQNGKLWIGFKSGKISVLTY